MEIDKLDEKGSYETQEKVIKEETIIPSKKSSVITSKDMDKSSKKSKSEILQELGEELYKMEANFPAQIPHHENLNEGRDVFFCN